MAIRKILTFPDPVLKRVSKSVERFDAELKTLVDDMAETMRAAPGIGLAAPQVGVSRRLIVVQIPDGDDTPGPLYAICNPVISRKDGHARIEEGCLSLPDFYVEVDRAESVTIEGRNPDGTPFRMDAQGLLAICFQHEIDHLNGKLLVNYVSAVKRELYRDEVKRRANRPDRGKDRRPAI